MLIVIDTALNRGTAEYQNIGDISMLQVAAARLRRLWPTACIKVLTESPANLGKYCPGTESLLRVGRDCWVGDRDSFNSFLFTRFHKYLPGPMISWLSGLIRMLEIKSPSLLRMMIRLRPIFGNGGDYKDNLIAFLEAMENADLHVVCGAGGFADSCKMWNIITLNTVEAAILRNIPVAMFGQGMGPLNDLQVLSRAKSILPQVSIITLRGGRGGLALLESLGVDASHILTSGDEAIDLAYGARTDEHGQALGVNLRVASYAEIDIRFIEKLRPILHEFARQHNAAMIPVPIAFHSRASDPQAIRLLLAGFDDQSDGGATLDTPLKVIKQAGRCRVVVTGAYHAAVFALAQGIPVVCLSNSPYYDAKFLGLEDQFGLGCETVSLNDPEKFEMLPAALERAWQSAESVRLPLQQAALRQIELSRSAYEQAKYMIDSKRFEKPGR
jgi:polysaccharide pyruvyl transferase WcaK-like protein